MIEVVLRDTGNSGKAKPQMTQMNADKKQKRCVYSEMRAWAGVG
jgi:hypothetical protein